MKKIVLIFLIILICSILEASDYVMMCTYFYNPEARIFRLNNEGEMFFDHNLEVGGNPESLCFSPNGKWGLIGSHTTSHPSTQKTIVLKVSKDKEISVMGVLHNEHEILIAISPDSRYGVHGADLKSFRVDNGTTFTVIPTENPIQAGFDADFSSLNGCLYVENGYQTVVEHKIAEDETIKPTGNTLDISPSSGYRDLEVSPDGKTCIALSGLDYQITAVRLRKDGGMSLVEMFNTNSNNAREVVFTPDSQYAIVSFSESGDLPDIRIYRINSDSSLDETDGVKLPNVPGEDLAITPDGKYIVTRALINNLSLFYVVKVNEDGTLTYLPDNDYQCQDHVSAMAFVPPQPTAAGNIWTLY